MAYEVPLVSVCPKGGSETNTDILLHRIDSGNITAGTRGVEINIYAKSACCIGTSEDVRCI